MEQGIWKSVKGLGFGFCALVGSLNAAQAVSVISDLDDTYKISGVLAPDSIRRFFKTPQSFPGMSAVYQDLGSVTTAPLTFVSGSPNMIRGKLEKFLIEEKLSEAILILRRVFFDEMDEYKVREIQKIFENYPQETFYLIGDDTQMDPDVYAKIQAMYPDRVAGVFIRWIQGRETLPAGQENFYFSTDLHARLTARGVSLGEHSLHQAFRDLKAEKDLNRVYPAFVACGQVPQILYSFWDGISEGQELSFRLKAICSTRVTP